MTLKILAASIGPEVIDAAPRALDVTVCLIHLKLDLGDGLLQDSAPTSYAVTSPHYEFPA